MSKRKFQEKDIPVGVVARWFHIRLKNRIVETVCTLVGKTSGIVYATGHAYVSPKDNASKKIGRDISVGRALKIYHTGEF